METTEAITKPSNLIRLLRMMVTALFICFIVLFIYARLNPKENDCSQRLQSDESILMTSFNGEIITLSPDAPEAVHEAPWDDFGDTIPRLASQALLPLLCPTGETFLMAPRPGTTAPLAFTACDPYVPQACDGVWIECPSVLDDREKRLFTDALLKEWSKVLNPNGVFICDLDARQRDPVTLQQHLLLVAQHFNVVYLWATGFQRWQIIATHSSLDLQPDAILARFQRGDLYPHFKILEMNAPWSLFAGAFSNKIQQLTACPPATTRGAIGLVETFLPCYEPASFPFKQAIPEIASQRTWRKAFYSTGRPETISDDPLILGIASIDYALAEDYVQQHNFTEALRLCKEIQTVAKPAIEHILFTFQLAHRLNDPSTEERMLHILEAVPLEHPCTPAIFTARYRFYKSTGQVDSLIDLLQQMATVENVTPQQRDDYQCESLFLSAEQSPTLANLKALHEFLRQHPSEAFKTKQIARYGELLKHYGDARTPLRFLAALSETKQWPNFDALQLEKEH
ncbi:MAG: hypothetical protein Q4F99_04780 [bacterium]|nr:hypothetical protein [bacterium]